MCRHVAGVPVWGPGLEGGPVVRWRHLSTTVRNLSLCPVDDGESMEICKQGSGIISFAHRKKSTQRNPISTHDLINVASWHRFLCYWQAAPGRSFRHSRFIFFCTEDSRATLCFKGECCMQVVNQTLGALELWGISRDIIYILPKLPFHKRLTSTALSREVFPLRGGRLCQTWLWGYSQNPPSPPLSLVSLANITIQPPTSRFLWLGAVPSYPSVFR